MKKKSSFCIPYFLCPFLSCYFCILRYQPRWNCQTIYKVWSYFKPKCTEGKQGKLWLCSYQYQCLVVHKNLIDTQILTKWLNHLLMQISKFFWTEAALRWFEQSQGQHRKRFEEPEYEDELRLRSVLAGRHDQRAGQGAPALQRKGQTRVSDLHRGERLRNRLFSPVTVPDAQVDERQVVTAGQIIREESVGSGPTDTTFQELPFELWRRFCLLSSLSLIHFFSSFDLQYHYIMTAKQQLLACFCDTEARE